MSETIICEEFGIYWTKQSLEDLQELIYIGLDANGDEDVHRVGNSILESIERRLK